MMSGIQADCPKEEGKIDPQLLSDFGAMAMQLDKLYRLKAEALAPEVDAIIRNGSTNKNSIECLLDHLLDCAPCDDGLVLFKRLLRYYYPLNSAGVASYIGSYREMYDDTYHMEEGND